jgi:hypothetical protein
MTYGEKLKDPRWQKKRLEILNRDEFTCQQCLDTTRTLMVHHRYYTKGLEPWEYEDSCYKTLCDVCHSLEHDSRPICEANLLLALKETNVEYHELQLLSQIFYNASFYEVYDCIRHFLSEKEIFDHCCPYPQPLTKRKTDGKG